MRQLCTFVLEVWVFGVSPVLCEAGHCLQPCCAVGHAHKDQGCSCPDPECCRNDSCRPVVSAQRIIESGDNLVVRTAVFVGTPIAQDGGGAILPVHLVSQLSLESAGAPIASLAARTPPLLI